MKVIAALLMLLAVACSGSGDSNCDPVASEERNGLVFITCQGGNTKIGDLPFESNNPTNDNDTSIDDRDRTTFVEPTPTPTPRPKKRKN